MVDECDGGNFKAGIEFIGYCRAGEDVKSIIGAMSVETEVSFIEPALERMPEVFSGEVTETELPVGEMVKPVDPIIVFSAYSSDETIIELPQPKSFEAKPMNWLEMVTRHKKETAVLTILATQTAFSGSSFGVGIVGGGMIGMGLAEFIKPFIKHDNDRAAAGCLTTLLGAAIGGFWAESAQIAQVLPFEAMLMVAGGLGFFFAVRSLAERWFQGNQDVIPLPQPKMDLKVQKGPEKETKMKIKLKDE